MARPNREIGLTVPQAVGGPVPAFREDGGRRKGRSMKKYPRGSKRGYVTVEQAMAAKAEHENVIYDSTLRCLVYKREV